MTKPVNALAQTTGCSPFSCGCCGPRARVSPQTAVRTISTLSTLASTVPLPEFRGGPRLIVGPGSALVEDEGVSWESTPKAYRESLVQGALLSFNAETRGDLYRFWRIPETDANEILKQAIAWAEVDFSLDALAETGLTRGKVAAVSEKVLRIAANLSAMTSCARRIREIQQLWIGLDNVEPAARPAAFKAALVTKCQSPLFMDAVVLLKGLSGPEYVQIFEARSLLTWPKRIFRRLVEKIENRRTADQPKAVKGFEGYQFPVGRLHVDVDTGRLSTVAISRPNQETSAIQKENTAAIVIWEGELKGRVKEMVQYLARDQNQDSVDRNRDAVLNLALRICGVSLEQLKKNGEALDGTSVNKICGVVEKIFEGMRANNREAIGNYFAALTQRLMKAGLTLDETKGLIRAAGNLSQINLEEILAEGKNLYQGETDQIDALIEKVEGSKASLERFFKGVCEFPAAHSTAEIGQQTGAAKAKVHLGTKEEAALRQVLTDPLITKIQSVTSVFLLDGETLTLLLGVVQRLTAPSLPLMHGRVRTLRLNSFGIIARSTNGGSSPRNSPKYAPSRIVTPSTQDL